MNWSRKDWIDLLLMVIGAILGVAVFGFIVAPGLGIEFVGNKPAGYMLAATAGTVSGYLLRFAVSRARAGQ